MRGPIVVLSLAVALAVPAAARSQDLLKTADPDVVLDVAKGFGSASLEKDSAGDPMINGRLEGLKYSIWFYDCKSGKDCRSIQLATGYTDDFSADKANEWNSKYRWVRAYAGGGSNFRMDVDFYGGVTRDYLENQFETWDTLVTDIKDFMRQK